MGNEAYRQRPNTLYDYEINVKSSFSRREVRLSPSDLTAQEQGRLYPKSVKRDIHFERVGSRASILAQMAAHGDIFDHFLRCCFPGSAIYIFEYPEGIDVSTKCRGIRYRDPELCGVYDRNSTTDRLILHRTTYYGSLEEHMPELPNVPNNIPRRGVGNCVGLIRLARNITGCQSRTCTAQRCTSNVVWKEPTNSFVSDGAR